MRGTGNQGLGLLVEHDHAGLLLYGAKVLFGLDQVFLGFAELLLEEQAAQLRFRDGKPPQHLGDLARMCVREVGCEHGFGVVDLDADQAALLVGRDADVLWQRLSQGLISGNLVPGLEVEPVDQRALHAVALEQRDIEFVG